MTQAAKKSYPKWLHIIWLIILFPFVYFAAERVIYQDSAFFLFRILNFDTVVENNRYAAFLTYVPAYLGSWLQLPLSINVILLSLGSFLLPWITSILLWFKTRNIAFTVLPALTILIPGPEMFFLSVTELTAAINYSLLLTGILAFPSNNKKLQSSSTILLLLLSFNAHPGILPVLLTIIGIQIIDRGIKSTIPLVSFFIIFILLKSFLIPNSSYEDSIFSQLSIANFSALFQSWGWKYFLSAFKTWLLFPTLFIILWTVYSLYSNKNKLHILLCFCIMLFNTFMLIIIYRDGDSETMMQKSFAPLAIGLSLPFLLLFLQTKKTFRIISISLIILLGINGYYQIFQTSGFYSHRLNQLKILPQSSEKIQVRAAEFPPERWKVIWALPYESLIVSQLLHRKSGTIKPFYSKNPDPIKNEGKGLFLGADFAAPIRTNKLNPVYFKFNDSACYITVHNFLQTN